MRYADRLFCNIALPTMLIIGTAWGAGASCSLPNFGSSFGMSAPASGCATVDNAFGNLQLDVSASVALDAFAQNVTAGLQTPQPAPAISAGSFLSPANFAATNAQSLTSSGVDPLAAFYCCGNGPLLLGPQIPLAPTHEMATGFFSPSAFYTHGATLPSSSAAIYVNFGSFNNNDFDTLNSSAFENPEPSSFILMGTALLLLAALIARRRSLSDSSNLLRHAESRHVDLLHRFL